jgi:hypothetical protein
VLNEISNSCYYFSSTLAIECIKRRELAKVVFNMQDLCIQPTWLMAYVNEVNLQTLKCPIYNNRFKWSLNS